MDNYNSSRDELKALDKNPNITEFKGELFEWGEALVTSLTIVILIFMFVIRFIGVEGSSMYPTLHDKDSLIISHLAYSPKKGDIVVLTKKSFLETPIVKRIIAVEGDVIDIDYTTGRVILNGKPLYEPYVNEVILSEAEIALPLTIPEDSIFVMGDNRNYSADSRNPSLGVVDERYILGKVIFRIFPFSNIGRVQ